MDPITFRSRRRLRAHRWRVPLLVRVLRRPQMWWAATGLVAAMAAIMVGNVHAQAQRNRDAWGESATVLVATGALEPGNPIGDHFVAEQWPRALIPEGTVDEVDPETMVVAAIMAGEPLVEARLNTTGAGLGARIPAGRSALAVSSVVIPVGLRAGDRVDLVATFPAGTDRADGVVASGAVVIEVIDDQITVAVVSQEVAATAAAITRGTLTVLVNGS